MDELQIEMMMSAIVQQYDRGLDDMKYAFDHGAKPNGFGAGMVVRALKSLKGTVDSMVVGWDNE